MEQNVKSELLKKHYRVGSISEGQEKIINAMLSGRDVLAGIPWGRDREICVQLPAVMAEGAAIVIYRSVMHMNAQVLSLVRSGVKAAYLNSTLNAAQLQKATENMKAGMYKIIYVTPHRFVKPEFIEACKEMNISYIAVDNAQYALKSDKDFDPVYTSIAEAIERLPKRPPIAAFASTLKGEVGQDIARVLRLKQDHLFAPCFDRKNLSYKLEKCGTNSSERYETLKKLISERAGKRGIVFCASAEVEDELYDRLNADGFLVAKQPMDPDEESKYCEDFLFKIKDILILPGGSKIHISEPDVDYVIHYNLPRDIETFYEESREAGIDGSPAESILVYSSQDPAIYKNILKAKNADGNASAKMNEMAAYAVTSKCLRRYLLSCFGEEAPEFCGNCSNCLSEGQEMDLTIPAKAILNCISITEQRYSAVTVKAVLRGTYSASVKKNNLNTLPVFGTMSDISDEAMTYYISLMEENGLVTVSDNEFKVLKITPKGDELLNGQTDFRAKVINRISAAENTLGSNEEYEIDNELMRLIKAEREEIARELNTAPYQVIPIVSVIGICKHLPKTLDEMKQISGIGEQKLGQFGERFVNTVNAYLSNTSNVPKKVKAATPQEKRQLVRKLEQTLGVQQGAADCIYAMKSDKTIKHTEELQYELARLYFMRDRIHIYNEKLTVTDFIRRVAEECYSEITVTKAVNLALDLFVEKGLINRRKNEEGKTVYSLTERSAQAEISLETVTVLDGSQSVQVQIGKTAQQLIIYELGNMAIYPVK